MTKPFERFMEAVRIVDAAEIGTPKPGTYEASPAGKDARIAELKRHADELLRVNDELRAELSRQSREARQRLDFTTADRLARLAGVTVPSEHEQVKA